MNIEKMHICISEIYHAAENISDLLCTLNTNDEVAVIGTKTKINQICNYIQVCDKLLHDELFPNSV